MLLPLFLLALLWGRSSCFEEVLDAGAPLHPSAVMGAFVPVHEAGQQEHNRKEEDRQEMIKRMEEDSLPQGVPKVLYSEQAEKRYQEIMGVEKRPNFIGGAPPRMAYQEDRPLPVVVEQMPVQQQRRQQQQPLPRRQQQQRQQQQPQNRRKPRLRVVQKEESQSDSFSFPQEEVMSQMSYRDPEMQSYMMDRISQDMLLNGETGALVMSDEEYQQQQRLASSERTEIIVVASPQEAKMRSRSRSDMMSMPEMDKMMPKTHMDDTMSQSGMMMPRSHMEGGMVDLGVDKMPMKMDKMLERQPKKVDMMTKDSDMKVVMPKTDDVIRTRMFMDQMYPDMDMMKKNDKMLPKQEYPDSDLPPPMTTMKSMTMKDKKMNKKNSVRLMRLEHGRGMSGLHFKPMVDDKDMKKKTSSREMLKERLRNTDYSVGNKGGRRKNLLGGGRGRANPTMLEDLRTIPGGPRVRTNTQRFRPRMKPPSELVKNESEKEDEEMLMSHRMASEMMRTGVPKSIQDIIEFQENSDGRGEKRPKRNNNLRLFSTFTTAKPLPLKPMKKKKKNSFVANKKKHPKLVLVNRSEKSDSPDDTRQVYEFQVQQQQQQQQQRQQQNKPGPPKPGDFQTIEVEASVPLELDYVMELIREGFFDEGNQDEVLKIDVQ